MVQQRGLKENAERLAVQIAGNGNLKAIIKLHEQFGIDNWKEVGNAAIAANPDYWDVIIHCSEMANKWCWELPGGGELALTRVNPNDPAWNQSN